MMHARQNNNSQALSAIPSLAGIGGVKGAVILAILGKTKSHAKVMLAEFVNAGSYLKDKAIAFEKVNLYSTTYLN